MDPIIPIAILLGMLIFCIGWIVLRIPPTYPALQVADDILKDAASWDDWKRFGNLIDNRE